MRVFKVRDKIDGAIMFIIAKDESEAIETAMTLTILPLEIVGNQSIDELPKPIIIKNSIAPF